MVEVRLVGVDPDEGGSVFRKIDGKAGAAGGSIGPKVVQGVCAGRKSELLPRKVEGLCNLADVEDGDVGAVVAAGLSRCVGAPDDGVVAVEELVGFAAVLIDGEWRGFGRASTW